MATVTHTGTVQSVTHTKTGSTHVYSVNAKYDVPNPAYPPTPPPSTEEDVVHYVDKDFYEDFRSALAGGKPVKTSYDDTTKAVSGVTINP